MRFTVFICLIVAALSGAQDASTAPQSKKVDVDEKTIRALLAELGDTSFEKREAAEKRLVEIGLPALELVRNAAKESKDLEIRERAAKLTDEISKLLYQSALKDNVWGNSVDPNRDCLFRVDAAKMHIRIPGKPHNLAIELGANSAPRVLREIEGNFQAEATVVNSSPSETRRLTGSGPWFGAGLLVWQDDNNYLRLERARMHLPPDSWRCYANWKLRQGGKLTKAGAGELHVLDAEKPVHLKLDRKGNAFTAEFSQDGKKWTELPTINVEFNKALRVGVTASHNTGTSYEAIFEGFKVAAGP